MGLAVGGGQMFHGIEAMPHASIPVHSSGRNSVLGSDLPEPQRHLPIDHRPDDLGAMMRNSRPGTELDGPSQFDQLMSADRHEPGPPSPATWQFMRPQERHQRQGTCCRAMMICDGLTISRTRT